MRYGCANNQIMVLASNQSENLGPIFFSISFMTGIHSFLHVHILITFCCNVLQYIKYPLILRCFFYLAFYFCFEKGHYIIDLIFKKTNIFEYNTFSYFKRKGLRRKCSQIDARMDYMNKWLWLLHCSVITLGELSVGSVVTVKYLSMMYCICDMTSVGVDLPPDPWPPP